MTIDLVELYPLTSELFVLSRICLEVMQLTTIFVFIVIRIVFFIRYLNFMIDKRRIFWFSHYLANHVPFLQF